jgi:HD-GYP domain-containing protein (c-di-GMP phosphodiesterase class II)
VRTARQPIAATAVLLLPAASFIVVSLSPRLNLGLPLPLLNFFAVTAVSVLASASSLVLAVASLRIGAYRVLFISLGFFVMGFLYAIDGLTTPGVLFAGNPASFERSVAGASAFLGLCLPSLFFAAGYTRLSGSLEGRFPFSAPRALVLTVVAGLAVYAAFALDFSDLIARIPFDRPPYVAIVVASSLGLVAFASWRQIRTYRITRLPLQATLIVAFLLIGQAQVQMILAPTWRLNWWLYQMVLLEGVALALGALVLEHIAGRSLRTALETALELEIKVGVELETAETISALAAAVEAKDENTKGHNLRVAEWAVRIGREMSLPRPTLRILARAGLLHDVGKIGIPDAILAKPGPLDDAEWKVIKQHPDFGVEILARLGTLRREAAIVHAHHERMDGSGYPRALLGDQIPLEARIIAVADTFDVLTSDRPYRQAHSRSAAVKVLQEESGAHLYEPAVEALLRLLTQQPAEERRPGESEEAA